MNKIIIDEDAKWINAYYYEGESIKVRLHSEKEYSYRNKFYTIKIQDLVGNNVETNYHRKGIGTNLFLALVYYCSKYGNDTRFTGEIYHSLNDKDEVIENRIRFWGKFWLYRKFNSDFLSIIHYAKENKIIPKTDFFQ